MLTKDYIQTLKHDHSSQIAALLQKHQDSGTLLFILENLGALPKNFDGSFLLPFLQHAHAQVRTQAAKNIAKLHNAAHFAPALTAALRQEQNTTARREIVSALGRMRLPANKPILLETLREEDPKIVCQAIRALLVFSDDAQIVEALQPLVNHPNEMVRTVIYREFFAEAQSKSDTLAHHETYPYLKNAVINADVLKALPEVPDDSVHLTFTSPPYYNARDYSIYPSYQAYLEFLQEVFQQVHRITKEGRFLIVNTSPIIIPRVSRAHSSKRYPIPFDLHAYIVANGWEFIDDIIWLKPEYSVKNRIGGFMQQRKPLMYKPNCVTEYLMFYRKATTKLIDWNIRNYDAATTEESRVPEGYETTNVWKIDPCFDKVHSAVFPAELCKRVIQYYSYKGDLVFDPFGGSGTVGRTAKALGRHFLLTEQERTYFDYMKSKSRPELLPEQGTRFFDTVEDFVQYKKKFAPRGCA